MRIGCTRRTVPAVVVCLSLWASSPATAQARGSHFLAELEGGVTLTGDGGPALSVDFGIGGKLRRFPPRFYWIAHVGLSHYSVEQLEGPTAYEEGQFEEVATGLRVYLPVVGELRWFGEGLIGATHADGLYSEPGLGPLRAEQWMFLGLLSTGLQLRVLQQVSVGARVGVALDDGGLVGVHRLAGAHADARTWIAAGLTWHF